jgi:hypothetical protein
MLEVAGRAAGKKPLLGWARERGGELDKPAVIVLRKDTVICGHGGRRRALTVKVFLQQKNERMAEHRQLHCWFELTRQDVGADLTILTDLDDAVEHVVPSIRLCSEKMQHLMQQLHGASSANRR